MEYITFIENNHKENEMFVFYLQYTGNEEALHRLNTIVSQADFSDMYGDYSTFMMDITTRISEDAVNQHIKLNYGCYAPMFQKVNGIFTLPYQFDEDTPMRLYAEILDNYFFGNRIDRYFKK